VDSHDRGTLIGDKRILVIGFSAIMGVGVAFALRSPGSTVTPGRRTVSGSGVSTGRTGTPRFVPPGSSENGRIETDPTNPRYDPTKFLRVMPVRNLFAMEPRSSDWAGPMEQFFREHVARDVSQLPAPIAIDVECKTTMCRFRWDAPGEAGAKIRRLISFLYIGSGAGSGIDDNEWVIMYKGGWLEGISAGNPEVLARALEAQRKKQLRVAKARAERGQPILRELSPSELPTENR
jgi:hypothetical protein